MTITLEVCDAQLLLNEIDAAQTAVLARFDRMRKLVQPPEHQFNPNTPQFKTPRGGLTDDGVEMVYEMFDAGKNRFKVKQAMQISFNAADYRHKQWQCLGGRDRIKA